MPEAIFSECKPLPALKELMARFTKGSGEPVLFTRLPKASFHAMPEEIRNGYDYDELSRTAWGDSMPTRKGSVAIVSAGTGDGYVAWEAARTLMFSGIHCDVYEDCGVAGLWRLGKKLEEISQTEVVIVTAGLDAALASVLGGLLPQPIIAVPTSVGYGIARSGKCALSSMLVSCAPGISVMNIDNGYGAACAALRILNTLHRD